VGAGVSQQWPKAAAIVRSGGEGWCWCHRRRRRCRCRCGRCRRLRAAVAVADGDGCVGDDDDDLSAFQKKGDSAENVRGEKEQRDE